jgi:nitrogen regulatory protein PII-like uncharacterized protein
MAVSIYTDYEFYLHTYRGTAIAAEDFARLARRASAVIDQVTYNRTAAVILADEDEDTIEKIKMATCAVADEVYTLEASGGVIQSESVGRHSVTYATPASQQKRLDNVAKTYLWTTELMLKRIDDEE